MSEIVTANSRSKTSKVRVSTERSGLHLTYSVRVTPQTGRVRDRGRMLARISTV